MPLWSTMRGSSTASRRSNRSTPRRRPIATYSSLPSGQSRRNRRVPNHESPVTRSARLPPYGGQFVERGERLVLVLRRNGEDDAHDAGIAVALQGIGLGRRVERRDRER